MVTGPRIAFRTDASLEIGTGHVMRCLTLARALRGAGAACRFVTRALPGHMGERIAAEGFDVTLLSAPQGEAPEGPPAHAHWAGVDWPTDAAETRAALDDAPDWLVMDHFAFDTRWQRAACPEGTRMMVIDDLADRPHACDLLFDQNLGHEGRDYDGLLPEACTRLMGPHYALLRSEFAERRAEALAAREGRGMRRLMVSMGGIDAPDATSAVLDALRVAPLPEELTIEVIMGGQAPALEKVRGLARDMPWPTEVAVDVDDMAGRMAAADLAIGAGGATTWERCCLGLPTIIIEIAANQAGIAAALSRAGAGLDPGMLNAPGFARRLAEALNEAGDPARLGAMSGTAATICDGEGVSRVLRQMVSLGHDGSAAMHVRPANTEDAPDVWHWRYFGNASRYFRNPVSVPLDQHLSWFEAALAMPDRWLLIVEKDGQPVTHVRLDRDAAALDMAEVSIYMNPAYRGKGLATPALLAALSFAQREGLHRFRAQAHQDNIASIGLFTKAGFVIIGQDDAFVDLALPSTDEGSAN